MLQDLYDSEINLRLAWFWDGGVEVHLGNGIYDAYTDEITNGGSPKNWEASGHFKDYEEAEEWIKEKAIELYPDSTFALKYRKDYKLFDEDIDESLDKLTIRKTS